MRAVLQILLFPQTPETERREASTRIVPIRDVLPPTTWSALFAHDACFFQCALLQVLQREKFFAARKRAVAHLDPDGAAKKAKTSIGGDNLEDCELAVLYAMDEKVSVLF